MNKKLSLIALILGISGSARAGSLSGVVLVDNGNPLAQALVIVSKPGPNAPGPGGRMRPVGAPFSRTVRTAADGTFSMSDLAAGRYGVCALGTQANHLNPCQWGGVKVAAITDSGSAFVTLSVRTGVLLNVTVSDPRGLIRLQDISGINASQTNLALGFVVDQRYYAPAKLDGRIGSMWKFSAAVPKRSSPRVLLDAPGTVTDEEGRAIAKRVKSLTLNVGDVDTALSLRVQ